MTLTWPDYVIIAIILISTLISLFRGFVREALSLAFWIIAFWVAQLFFREVSVHLERWIAVPSLRYAAAFAILFILVLFLGALLTFLIGQIVDATGLSGTDRAIGMLFGLARGALVVGALVLLAGLTPMPNDPWWKQSVLLGHFQDLAVWMRSLLPDDLAQRISFGAEGLVTDVAKAVTAPNPPPASGVK
jgi:membrane protein required for colicin V production